MRKYKYLIIISILVFIISIAGSYAYFAYETENTTAIKGNIVAIDADLTVELVVGTNDEMVPMLDGALSNAINGVGSNTPCIDSQGNLSCQVYKITLTNNGSRLKNLQGTIELYAKSGGTYTNLKWQELSNPTTVKEGTSPNGMAKSILVSGLTLQSKEAKTWYIAVWISETDYDQTNTDKGDFGGTVTFEAVEKTSTEFIEETLKQNATLDTDIDFSAKSSDTNGTGIYLRSGTENDTYPIYYYRGAVEDNNLIFANFCWKIVRTTETGGMKLIYNGTPTDGTCDNTGTSSQISTKAFNTNYASPAYVGYMYGNPYDFSQEFWTQTDMSSNTSTIMFGNNISYSNGVYTLTGGTISNTWANVYESGLTNYHYTCFNSEGTCTNVHYIFHAEETVSLSFQLTDGMSMARMLSQMLDYNTTSSTIKGNSTTEGTLDYWYYNNIETKGYSSYIEDTVWCNDRSTSSLGSFNKDGGITDIVTDPFLSSILFSTYDRVVNSTPSYACARDIDKFTVSSENGNGDLDYPVGLLTLDEAMFAGGAFAENTSYYLYTGENYWAGAPFLFGFSDDEAAAAESYVNSGGSVGGYYVDIGYGVRPSVSLKPGFTIVDGGTGTTSNPYVVE